MYESQKFFTDLTGQYVYDYRAIEIHVTEYSLMIEHQNIICSAYRALFVI